MQNLVQLLFILGQSFQRLNFESLTIFGDSISDTGPDLMGITHGFKKFCSGPNWVDFMGRALRIEPENYAYSGAKSDTGNYYGYNWSGGLWQIEKYLEAHENKVTANALIGMQAMGINDFCAKYDYKKEPNPTEVADNLFQSLNLLADNGAKHILIFNIMDMGPTPWVAVREQYRKDLSQFTETTNILIAERIQELKEMFPETNFYAADIEKVVTDIEKTGSLKMGTFNYSQKAVEAGTAFDYAFFDSWHPASVVHSQVAYEGFKTLFMQTHEARRGATNLDSDDLDSGLDKDSESTPIWGDLYTRIRESIGRNRQIGQLE